MNNIIIGTAGHVDHGKTSLIKALTGIDTDRLMEEKKRGITIDLGFAHLDLGGGLRAGIVDVPGHEKFIKNMLAGSGGIDLALLAVDAGEGIMPQTKEHFEILKLLDIKRGVIAITKADAAEPDWINMVREDIASLVEGSFLEGAPVIETSAYTGQGLAELKKALRDAVSQPDQKRIARDFRLPIDRVFSVEGFGTVVTGTLIEGEINRGDGAVIYTSGALAKARNLQVHDISVETARCGQRVAVNLSSVKKSGLKRGFVVAKPGSMENTFMADVKLSLLAGTERTVKNNSRVHFYYGAMETLAKVVLFDKDELRPGESAYAQLRLSDEAAFKYGDRYIIRFYSPMETIGGGMILNPCPQKRHRNKTEALKGLEALDMGRPEDVIEVFTEELGGEFANIDKIRTKSNLISAEFNGYLESLIEKGQIVRINDEVAISSRRFKEIIAGAGKILKDFHDKNPLKKGMNPEEFKSRLLSGAGEAVVNAVVSLLADKKIIGVQDGLVYREGFKVKINDESQKTMEEIEKIYLDAGVLVPNKDEALSKINGRNKARVFDSMVEGGVLIMIDKQMFFHAEAYNSCLQALKDYIAENGEITLAQFRDLIGAPRKYAVALLEYWDARKITKKTGDARILVKK